MNAEQLILADLLRNTLLVFNSLLTLLGLPNSHGFILHISGSNIDTTDGSTANTVSALVLSPLVYILQNYVTTQDTLATFSFSQSYTQADALPTSGSYCRSDS